MLGQGGGSRVWARTLQAWVLVFRVGSPVSGAGVNVVSVRSGTGSWWNVAIGRCHSDLHRRTEQHWTTWHHPGGS